MKANVKKANDELIIDYSKMRDIHEFRYNVLDYIIHTKENAILFIDTNASIRKLLIDEITAHLESNKVEFNIVPIAAAEKKFFGLTNFFGKKKEPQITENILMVMVTKNDFTKKIYTNFLMYYDYGVLTGIKESLGDMLDLYRADHSEVMFNKEVSKSCYYDSIIFTRMRSNSDDLKFENYVRQLET